MRDTSATRFHFLALLRLSTLSFMAPVHSSDSSSSTSSKTVLLPLLFIMFDGRHSLELDHTAPISAVPGATALSTPCVPTTFNLNDVTIGILHLRDHHLTWDLFHGSYTGALACAPLWQATRTCAYIGIVKSIVHCVLCTSFSTAPSGRSSWLFFPASFFSLARPLALLCTYCIPAVFQSA